MIPTLEIDLKALKYNYLYIKGLVNSIEIFPVIKNNAYGLGIDRVSKVLKAVNCNNVFVGNICEGQVVRTYSGIDNIFILNGFSFNEENYLYEYKLIPVINSFSQLLAWEKFCREKEKKLDTVLQFDIGLNRVGLEKKLIDRIIESRYLENFNTLFIMAHLSNSFIVDDECNEKQLREFLEVIKNFPNLKYSLIASYGLCLPNMYNFDIARPGILLTGYILPNLLNKFNDIRQTVKLKTKIIHIRDVPQGNALGYGQIYKTSKDSIIAIIFCGFGSGLTSLLSNKSYVTIENFKAPIVGYISMDLAFIDVSNIPDNLRNKGQEVVVYGALDDMMLKSKITNISMYELLSNLGNNINIAKKYVE
jgi:alanine racemase